MTTLPASAPFDFSASLRFLNRFPPTAGEQRITTTDLTKALRAGGTTVVARLTADGQDGLACELHAATPFPEAEAADRLSFHLSLADDLAAFYELGKDDEAFAPVIDELYGYHQVKFPSPLENLVWSILCQRTALPVAAKAKQSIVAEFGNSLELDGVTYHAFPDLEQLLSLPADRLAALVRNARQAQRLHAALRGWAEVDETFLRTAPHPEVRAFLLGLPGIGAWSASFILVRGLGRMEETLVDKELRRSASRIYGPLPDERLRALADHYGPWQGYWAHYLRAAT
ncbi:hypothetical protein [Nonomuraea sp. NPDC046570]|uniref:DNA-3-methyladenine glycosylase family protein n=1 Tax=Nonomuraea sp. NPDC046570 TaxID=3155255 RepID=UPI0033DE80ED